MATGNEIVCRLLGLDIPPQTLNLYSLIRLPNGADDPTQIQSGLKQAMQRLKIAAASGAGPAEVALAKRALQQCQNTLLQPAAKSQYDQTLQASPASAPAPNTPSKPASPARPAGPASSTLPTKSSSAVQSTHPATPKPPSEQLAGRPTVNPVLQQSAAERLRQLQAAAAAAKSEDGASDDSSGSISHGSFVAATGSGSGLSLGGSRTGMQASTQVGRNIQARIRRRRAIRNAITLGSLLLVCAGLLGYAYYRFAYQRPGGGSLAAAGSADSRDARPTPTPSENVSISPDASEPSDAPPSRRKPTRPADDIDLPTGFAELPEIGSANQQDGRLAGMVEMENAFGQRAADNADAMEQPEVKFDPAAGPAIDQARRALREENFPLYDAAMNQLTGEVVGDADDEMRLQKLDRTGQLLKFGFQALTQGLGSLKGTDTLKLEDGEDVLVIESSPENLVVRRGGERAAYDADALPLDVLEAVLNQSLPLKTDVNIAARGAFLLTYSGEAEFQRRGEELLQQAATMDSKFDELDREVLKPR